MQCFQCVLSLDQEMKIAEKAGHPWLDSLDTHQETACADDRPVGQARENTNVAYIVGETQLRNSQTSLATNLEDS